MVPTSGKARGSADCRDCPREPRLKIGASTHPLRVKSSAHPTSSSCSRGKRIQSRDKYEPRFIHRHVRIGSGLRGRGKATLSAQNLERQRFEGKAIEETGGCIG